MKTYYRFNIKKILLPLYIFFFGGTSFSAVIVTAPSLSINSCGTFPTSYSNLGNIVITEGALNDFPIASILTNYTITLTAPANFQFNPGVGTVGASAGDITLISINVTATTITITYSSGQGNRVNGADVLTVSGIQVRGITGVATQTATKTGSTETIVGFANGTVVANLSSTAGICATPGGVSGLTLWMKSDAGTSTTVHNAPISSWVSQAISPSVTLSQGSVALQPTYRDGSGTGVANRFNYNPFVYTDGTSNRLFLNGDINLGNVSTGMSSYQAIGEDLGIVSMDWYHTGNGSVKMKGDGNLYINSADGTTQNNRKITPTSIQACITDIRGVPGAITSGRSNGIEGAVDVGNRVATQNGISIGSNVDNGEYMQGGMGEYIVFSSTLSVADNLKVESYLAIKYGVTLGTTALVSNYTSSNNTVVWTGNSAYQNNIIGIGRDDVSTLNQKQSHYYSDIFRIYKGTLTATNQTNASSFAVDQSFVLSGDNNGLMCATNASNVEIPTGLTSCALTSRIEREWRVTRSNMNETINMDVQLAACGAPGAVATVHLRFLVDDDGNFANGGTQCYYNGDGTGIVITYANPYITISNINTTHLPNNATRFVTVASIDPSTPLPIEVVHYDAALNSKNTVDLTWVTISERDNDYFTILKSTDGINWSSIKTIDGAGTSTNELNYYSEDIFPFSGINYYKLMQTDFNGTTTEVGIRSVNFKGNEEYFVFPNPSNQILNISSNSQQFYTVQLYNQLGEILGDFDNETIIPINDFADGLYTIRIEDANGVYNLKVVIKN